MTALSTHNPRLDHATDDITLYLDELQHVMIDTSIDDDVRDERVVELQAEIDVCKSDISGCLTAIRNRIVDDEGDIAAMEVEIKRLQDRKRTRENRIKGRKEWALYQLQRMERSRFETSLFTMSVAKNTPKLVIDNEDGLPSIRTMPEIWKRQAPVLDKSALKAIVKEGTEVPGCRLEQGERLAIK